MSLLLLFVVVALFVVLYTLIKWKSDWMYSSRKLSLFLLSSLFFTNLVLSRYIVVIRIQFIIHYL